MLPVLVKGFLSHPIARRHPVASAARIVSWQVRSRLMRGPHVVPFVDGTRLWARRGEAGVTGNIYYGLHELATMAFVLHALRPDDLFADIGANAGTYALLAAAVARARVVAVEPVPDTVERLRANLELNGVERLVRVEACALSASSGTVRVTGDLDTTNRVVCGDEMPGALELPSVTADEMFQAEEPTVMKIDVEGHEDEVLRGASRMLSCPGPVAVILEVSADFGQVAERLAGWGFEPRTYDPFRRRLSAGREGAAVNALFVHAKSEEALAARLASARPVPVFGMSI